MHKQKKHFLSKILSLILSLSFVGLVIYGALNWLSIKDFISNLNYEPSVEIAQISEKLNLTNSAQQTFYSTRPEIQDAEKFNENCTNKFEQSAVLGCYKNDRIFVYDIKDEKLDGIKEATSAHEILHAVWARMNENERTKISEKLNAEYEKVKTPELEETMAAYARTEPGQHENELHSILATEFENLSPELEEYYRKIFNDRKKVFEFYQNYHSRFDELKNKSAEISQKLQILKAEIDSETANYQTDLANLNQQIEQFNEHAKNNFYQTQMAFNADRDSLNLKKEQLENNRNLINQKVSEYNDLISQANQISIQTNELNESINSKLKSANEL